MTLATSKSQTRATPRLVHGWIDATHALIAGGLFVALGLTMFAHAGLLTGGLHHARAARRALRGARPLGRRGPRRLPDRLPLLALLRHQASVGGVNILAQWLQQKKGLRAGKVQMSVDLLVVATALFVVPPQRVLQSVLGALLVSANPDPESPAGALSSAVFDAICNMKPRLRPPGHRRTMAVVCA